MPLTKKLCEKCWIKRFGLIGFDDRYWEDGYIWCPLEYLGTEDQEQRKITEPPPSKCPFILEHILTNQKEN